MRQIKFRVWNGEKMLYPEFFGTDAFGSKGLITIGWSNQPYIDLGSIGKAPYEAREGCTLMQFTGLLDCEGKEVYEGDIIEEYNSPIYREVVAWDSENGAWGYFSSQGNYNWAHEWGESQGTPLSQMKVIGNLYEHPQLLNND